MTKCDVCGKTSLLPEIFGNVGICKPCFLKANGLFWKRTYERYEDAEKQRTKALEAANKQNFPQTATTAIDEFFMQQMNAMLTCDCCGHPVRLRQPLGKANICLNCYKKIDNCEWQETEYEDNEEVEENRTKILKIARKNRFPQIVIDGINEHFNSKMQKGLICSLDNHIGQKLKIYETHCVITTEPYFNMEENAKAYGKALKSSHPKESMISNGTAKVFAQNLLSKGIVNAGISLVASAAINVASDKILPEKGMFKVVRGDYTIDYLAYDRIDFQKSSNEVGFIRFHNSDFGESATEDIVYIFRYNGEVEEAYNEICKWSSIARQTQSTIHEAPATQQPTATSLTSADEIMKFKQLLDMGAITQEEFDAKKKQLLGL